MWNLRPKMRFSHPLKQHNQVQIQRRNPLSPQANNAVPDVACPQRADTFHRGDVVD